MTMLPRVGTRMGGRRPNRCACGAVRGACRGSLVPPSPHRHCSFACVPRTRTLASGRRGPLRAVPLGQHRCIKFSTATHGYYHTPTPSLIITCRYGTRRYQGHYLFTCMITRDMRPTDATGQHQHAHTRPPRSASNQRKCPESPRAHVPRETEPHPHP